MKKEDKFSLRSRVKSFKYAFDGIIALFQSEHNMYIHLLATIAVFVLAILLNISMLEIIALILSVWFVWMAELLNTAIEKIMNFISIEKNPQIKIIKDLAASVVLIAAIIALLVGSIIFIPKIYHLLF